ncbi:hypothetical protein [Actinomadura miaoliensis]|uniref:Uncharacterized protein n=1 Tax=Actinomadura miaoliensis TaxID=430685 RepID=A0ABP7WU73_9ACTN
MPLDRPRKAAVPPEHSRTTSLSAALADQALADLRQDFTGHRIWRSVRWDGSLGDWVATLHDPTAGIDATVIRSNPNALRKALGQQAEQAKARRAETR